MCDTDGSNCQIPVGRLRLLYYNLLEKYSYDLYENKIPKAEGDNQHLHLDELCKLYEEVIKLCEEVDAETYCMLLDGETGTFEP